VLRISAMAREMLRLVADSPNRVQMGATMSTHVRRTAQLGELVAAFFDEAARYSDDPGEVSRLATRSLMHMLRRPPRTRIRR
jgi:hypothetical protein